MKFVFVVTLVSVVAAAVAAFVTRKKLGSMTDDEIRGFLASKLEGKVDEDQLSSIQDAVISGVRSKNGASHDAMDDAKGAEADLTDSTSGDIYDASASAGSAAEKAGDKAAEMLKAVGNATS